MGLIVHDMYIYNSLLTIFKVLIILTVLSISRFYDTYTSRSGVGGVRLNQLYYVIIILPLRSVLVKCSYNSHNDYGLYDYLRYVTV